MTNAKQIDVKVPPPLYKDIDSLADEWGLSLSETAMYILKWYVDHGPVREFMSEEARENRAQVIKARLPVYAGLRKKVEGKPKDAPDNRKCPDAERCVSSPGGCRYRRNPIVASYYKSEEPSYCEYTGRLVEIIKHRNI